MFMLFKQLILFFFFLFFQAEDGIRDIGVTGVQTCALPIFNGKLAPVVGKICMDQCMIDITDIPNVKIGDEVILIGESNGLKITIDDLAKLLGTINYEDRKSTRLNSSHANISYAVFCLKKKKHLSSKLH